MKRITIGFTVRQSGKGLELCSSSGATLTMSSVRSRAFYDSRFYFGGATTVFSSRRAAERAITRTKKSALGTGTFFDGKDDFEVERIIAPLPFTIDTTAKVTVTPAN